MPDWMIVSVMGLLAGICAALTIFFAPLAWTRRMIIAWLITPMWIIVIRDVVMFLFPKTADFLKIRAPNVMGMIIGLASVPLWVKTLSLMYHPKSDEKGKL